MQCIRTIRSTWAAVSAIVASQPEPFLAARDKELRVKEVFFDRLCSALPDAEVELSRPGSQRSQIRFGRKEIDLTVVCGGTRVAIEVKFKVRSDGAYPDNRTAAFDDIAKLQLYTQDGAYSHGVFAWLTDRPEYYHDDVSATPACSTHHGRVVLADTPIKVARARDGQPRQWSFPWQLEFVWDPCAANAAWRWLMIQIPPRSSEPTVR